MEIDFDSICSECIQNRARCVVVPTTTGETSAHAYVKNVGDHCISRQKNGQCKAKELFDEFLKTIKNKKFNDIGTCCQCCLGKSVAIDPIYMKHVVDGNGSKTCPLTLTSYSSIIARNNECPNLLVKVMRS